MGRAQHPPPPLRLRSCTRFSPHYTCQINWHAPKIAGYDNVLGDSIHAPRLYKTPEFGNGTKMSDEK